MSPLLNIPDIISDIECVKSVKVFEALINIIVIYSLNAMIIPTIRFTFLFFEMPFIIFPLSVCGLCRHGHTVMATVHLSSNKQNI